MGPGRGEIAVGSGDGLQDAGAVVGGDHLGLRRSAEEQGDGAASPPKKMAGCASRDFHRGGWRCEFPRKMSQNHKRWFSPLKKNVVTPARKSRKTPRPVESGFVLSLNSSAIC